MPGLVDLHRHLDGSLRLATVVELAQNLGLPVPAQLRFYPGMGLAEALSYFAFTLSLLRTESAVSRVASEICEDAEADGVTGLEIRFAPQLHVTELDERDRPAAMAAILDAALKGIAGRAGVLLCGLYGEPPSMLESLVELAKDRPGVVGIDLAGGPLTGHSFGLSDYRDAYQEAKRLGLGTTVHAGEGRPPEEIRQAVLVLGADRIGHGTSLLRDADITTLVRERGVTIEVCITSNIHVGAISRAEEHPIGGLLSAGVKVCVCTDNTLFSAVTSSSEYALAKSLPGVGEVGLKRLLVNGHSARFVRRSPSTA